MGPSRGGTIRLEAERLAVQPLCFFDLIRGGTRYVL